MGDYHYDLVVVISCEPDHSTILSTAILLEGQTLVQIYAQAQTQLAIILAELVALHPGCTSYSAHIYDPSIPSIDYTVSSASLVLLIAQVYAELIYILATL